MSQTNPFTALLAAQPFVLLDGAMATERHLRPGAKVVEMHIADQLRVLQQHFRRPQAVSQIKVLLENPQLIRDVHLDYFRAGAQVAITASYQATPAGPAGSRRGTPRALCAPARRFCRSAPGTARHPARVRQNHDAQSRALIGKSVELARKAREAYLAENPQAGTLLARVRQNPPGWPDSWR
jgi:homocysteine S-methyltransferase